VEYTYFPQSDSDNTFRRFRAFLNAPIKIGEDSYLVPGFEYRNINMKLRDEFTFVTNDKERFQSLNPSLGYTWKMKNDWRYAVKAGIIITSNFNDKLTRDDYVFEGEAFIIKDKDRKSTRLNSSHVKISYAVFCLKKKKIEKDIRI